MSKLRCFPSKSFIDHELFWGVGNVVVSTDDVRDLHIVVIDHNGKVVSWVAIFLLDDPIPTDIATFKFDISFDHIMPLVDTRLIHCQTNRWDDTCCFTFCDVSCFFFFAHAKVFVDVARCFPSCFLAFTFCCQLFFSDVRFVGFTFSQELVNVFLIEFQTFRLAVVFMRLWAFIPVHAQPTKVFKLGTFAVFDVTFAVRILDTDDKGSTMVTRVQVVKQCCTSISDV